MKWLPLLALSLGCATAPAAKPHRVAPAYKSSLEAVLARGSELALSEAQRRRFDQLEARREQQDAESRSRARAEHEASAAAPSPPPGGRGRGTGRRGGGAGHAEASRDPSLNQQLDDHDTQAFTAALDLMTEAQKPRAIEIASHYREELFDYRQSLRSAE